MEPIPARVETEKRSLPLWIGRQAAGLSLPDPARRADAWDRMVAELTIRPWAVVEGADRGWVDSGLGRKLDHVRDLYLAGQINQEAYQVHREGLLARGRGTAKLHLAVLADQTFYHWIGETQKDLPARLAKRFRAWYEHDPNQLRYTLEVTYDTPAEFDTLVAIASNQLLAIPI